MSKDFWWVFSASVVWGMYALSHYSAPKNFIAALFGGVVIGLIYGIKGICEEDTRA